MTEAAIEPIPFDAPTARAFARVAAELRGNGRRTKVPPFDVIIAATALLRNLPILHSQRGGLHRNRGAEVVQIRGTDERVGVISPMTVREQSTRRTFGVERGKLAWCSRKGVNWDSAKPKVFPWVSSQPTTPPLDLSHGVPAHDPLDSHSGEKCCQIRRAPSRLSNLTTAAVLSARDLRTSSPHPSVQRAGWRSSEWGRAQTVTRKV